MKTVKKITIAILAGITLITIGANFYPVKWSVRVSQLKDKQEYILVEQSLVTVAPWKVVGDQNGMYSNDVDIPVRLQGNEMSGYNYNVDSGHNTFVCYGKFLDDGKLAGETYRVFEVNDWDIIYPIKRNALLRFLMPRAFLCKADMK